MSVPETAKRIMGEPRGRSAAIGELAGVIQVPRLAWHLPGLLTGPRGHGTTVIVIPGRNTGDTTTLPLRSYLRMMGYRPQGWGLGQNHGRVDELVPPMAERVRLVATATGGPVPLVGQSMGGYIAREVARLVPEDVDRVVTLGTPIFGPRSPGPIRCPVTAVYSQADRVVSTARSIDADPATANVEVSSPHFTMGIDPDVWRVVVQALQRPAGTGG